MTGPTTFRILDAISLPSTSAPTGCHVAAIITVDGRQWSIDANVVLMQHPATVPVDPLKADRKPAS